MNKGLPGGDARLMRGGGVISTYSRELGCDRVQKYYEAVGGQAVRKEQPNPSEDQSWGAFKMEKSGSFLKSTQQNQADNGKLTSK